MAIDRADPRRRGEWFESPPHNLRHLLWRFSFSRGEPGPLLTLGDQVVVASPLGNLFFLRVHDGSLRTRAYLNSRARGLCALPEGIVAVSEKGEVFRFSFSGNQEFHRNLAAPVITSPLCFLKELWIATADGYLFILDSQRGKLLSSLRILPPNPSPLAYSPERDTFFAGGEDFALYALPRRSLEKGHWIATMNAPITNAPVIGREFIFVTDVRGTLGAFTHSGELRWQHALSGTPLPPVYSEGKLVVATRSGTLMAIQERDGSILWSLSGDPVVSPLTLSSGKLFYCRPGRVEMSNLADGVKVSEFPIPGERCGEPVFSAGIVFVTTDEGEVVAVGE